MRKNIANLFLVLTVFVSATSNSQERKQIPIDYLGMSFEVLKDRLVNYRKVDHGYGEDSFYYVRRSDLSNIEPAFWICNGEVTSINVIGNMGDIETKSKLQTPEGIQIGSTLEDLVNLYDNLLVYEHWIGGGVLESITDIDETSAFIFIVTKNNDVGSYRLTTKETSEFEYPCEKWLEDQTDVSKRFENKLLTNEDIRNRLNKK